MTPPERAPYTDQEDILQFKADVKAYNDRIPLSPLIDVDVTFDEMNNPTVTQSDGYDLIDEIERRRRTQIWNRYRRDHPKAFEGSDSPMPEKPFRFLDLPLDIRNIIYEHVLSGYLDVMIQMEPDGSAGQIEDHLTGPVDVRIFAVSRQVYEEATTIFFHMYTVHLPLGDSGTAEMAAPMFREAAQKPYCVTIEKLKKINIHLPLSKQCKGPHLHWVVKRVCALLAQHACLKEMRITPVSYSSWYIPALDTVIDQIMEVFTLLRGVKKVVFTNQSELPKYGSGRGLMVGTEEQKQRLKRIMTS